MHRLPRGHVSPGQWTGRKIRSTWITGLASDLCSSATYATNMNKCIRKQMPFSLFLKIIFLKKLYKLRPTSHSFQWNQRSSPTKFRIKRGHSSKKFVRKKTRKIQWIIRDPIKKRRRKNSEKEETKFGHFSLRSSRSSRSRRHGTHKNGNASPSTPRPTDKTWILH